MVEILKILLSYGLYGFIGYVVWNVCKIIALKEILKHPSLSDEKVKHLTNMISKDKD